MRYTAKDLQKVSNTSLQSINKLFKSNSELKELSKEHRTVENRSVYYDEVIYEWFCRRYSNENKPNVFNVVAGEYSRNENEENPQHTAPVDLRQNEVIKAELAELKAKYAELEARFQATEAERKQLLEQNGNLLLLLSQEKAEKQKLLPPPRKSISERIKNLFRKPPTDN